MKQILFSAFFILFISFSNAQDFYYGIKGGVSFSGLGKGNDDENYTSKTGFHLGGVLEFPFTEKFSLQTELLYSSEGAKAEFSRIDPWMANGEYDINLHYLRLPMIGKYYVFKNLSLEGGMNLGVLMEAKVSGFPQGPTGPNRQNIRKGYTSMDAQIALGSTYKLNSGVFFSVRYNKGIVDIDNTKTLDFNPVKKSNVFQISAGYLF